MSHLTKLDLEDRIGKQIPMKSFLPFSSDQFRYSLVILCLNNCYIVQFLAHLWNKPFLQGDLILISFNFFKANRIGLSLFLSSHRVRDYMHV